MNIVSLLLLFSSYMVFAEDTVNNSPSEDLNAKMDCIFKHGVDTIYQVLKPSDDTYAAATVSLSKLQNFQHHDSVIAVTRLAKGHKAEVLKALALRAEEDKKVSFATLLYDRASLTDITDNDPASKVREFGLSLMNQRLETMKTNFNEQLIINPKELFLAKGKDGKSLIEYETQIWNYVKSAFGDDRKKWFEALHADQRLSGRNAIAVTFLYMFGPGAK